MSALGRFAGQTVTLVGRGPSLANLTREHLGAGPVLALNMAWRAVERVGTRGPVFVLYKDGCLTEQADRECPCGVPGPYLDGLPEHYTLLLSRENSSGCLAAHHRREVIDLREWWMLPTEMSVLVALRVAQTWGAARVRMVSFDSLTTGDTHTWSKAKGENAHAAASYAYVEPFVRKALEGVEHEWITP